MKIKRLIEEINRILEDVQKGELGPSSRDRYSNGRITKKYKEGMRLSESIHEEDTFVGDIISTQDEGHYIVELDGIPGIFHIWAEDYEELRYEATEGDWVYEILDQLESEVSSVSVEIIGGEQDNAALKIQMTVVYDVDEDDEDSYDDEDDYDEDDYDEDEDEF